MKITQLSVLVLVIAGLLSAVSAQQNNLTEEQKAAVEDASFQDFDGNEYHISDFKGKTVLIDFWETWCGPCINSMPTLDQLMKDYEDDFVVLATSLLWTDSEEVVRQFIDNNDYTFYYVTAGNLATDLQISGIPFKVYVDPSGKFYKAETGSRGSDRDYSAISEVIENNRRN